MNAIQAAKLGALAAKQALGLNVDPTPAGRFFIYLELGSVIEAKFTEISGMEITRENESYKEGGNSEEQLMTLGDIDYGSVTLSRGVTFSRNLWDWFMEDPPQPKNMSIILYSPYWQMPARWYNLIGVVPTKLTLPTFGTDEDKIAIEEIELDIEKIEMESIKFLSLF